MLGKRPTKVRKTYPSWEKTHRLSVRLRNEVMEFYIQAAKEDEVKVGTLVRGLLEDYFEQERHE
jgi:hypothetical protein